MSEPRAGVEVSVCIANYNGGTFVLDCLASVFAQQVPFPFEVLVHDDASTDGSLERIRSRFPGTRILAGRENAGFCISNNRLAEIASGRYMLFLNNDATLAPGSLARLAAVARERGDVILGLPQHTQGDRTLLDRGYWTDPFLNPIACFQPGDRQTGVVTGACLWVPRNAWDKIGGFPPWFESVAEDIFLCMAARLLGHAVLVLDGPGFEHWVGRNLGGGKLVDGALRTTARRRALSERNKTFAMLCCYPWQALVLLLPLHLLFLACEAVFLLSSGTGAGMTRRIYAGILPAIWHRRRELLLLRRRLMRQRKASASELFAFTRWFPHKLRMLARHGRPGVD